MLKRIQIFCLTTFKASVQVVMMFFFLSFFLFFWGGGWQLLYMSVCSWASNSWFPLLPCHQVLQALEKQKCLSIDWSVVTTVSFRIYTCQVSNSEEEASSFSASWCLQPYCQHGQLAPQISRGQQFGQGNVTERLVHPSSNECALACMPCPHWLTTWFLATRASSGVLTCVECLCSSKPPTGRGCTAAAAVLPLWTHTPKALYCRLCWSCTTHWHTTASDWTAIHDCDSSLLPAPHYLVLWTLQVVCGAAWNMHPLAHSPPECLDTQ